MSYPEDGGACGALSHAIDVSILMFVLAVFLSRRDAYVYRELGDR